MNNKPIFLKFALIISSPILIGILLAAFTNSGFLQNRGFLPERYLIQKDSKQWVSYHYPHFGWSDRLYFTTTEGQEVVILPPYGITPEYVK